MLVGVSPVWPNEKRTKHCFYLWHFPLTTRNTCGRKMKVHPEAKNKRTKTNVSRGLTEVLFPQLENYGKYK